MKKLILIFTSIFFLTNAQAQLIEYNQCYRSDNEKNWNKNSFKLDIYSNLGKIYSKSFNLNKNKQLILDNSQLLKLKNKSGEMCWYTITSKKNNIHAFSFHENKKSGSISGEHSF